MKHPRFSQIPAGSTRRTVRLRTWLPLLGVSAALHCAVWALLLVGQEKHAPFAIGLAVYLCLSALLVPAGVLAARAAARPGRTLLSWGGMLALGLLSSLFVFGLLRLFLLPLLDALGAPVLGWAEPAARWVVWLALCATVLGWVVTRLRPALIEVEIPIAGLPADLHGFRIVQISDIHVGPTVGRAHLQRIVDQVNALQADLVAITGDVVDGDVPTLQAHVAPLQQLRAREGVALVIGNHELYSGAPDWVQEFRRLGLRVLLNEHFLVRRAQATLAVAGVTDHSTARFFAELAPDPHAAIRGAETAHVRVLLAHQPASAPDAAAAGFHLALHGHTHGGQWWPWNHFVRVQQPVLRGLHRFGMMWSYTSVGTGYWGPPKRHFRSEITLLTLRAAPCAPV